MSKVWNKKIFENIQHKVDKASKDLLKKEVLALTQLNMELMRDFQIKLQLRQLLQFQLFVEEHHQA